MGFFSKFKRKPEEPEELVLPDPIEPENAYFGREPIVDKNSVLMGFELFFRMGTEADAERANAIALRRAEMIFAGATPEEIAEKDLDPNSYLPFDDAAATADSDQSESEVIAEGGQEQQGDTPTEDETTTDDLLEQPPEPFVKLSEIMRALREKGVANSLGRQIGFIKVNKEILLDKKLRSVPALKFALEVPHQLLADPDVLKECESLNRVKYQLVLTHFDHLFEGYKEILPLFRFVKLDPAHGNPEQLKEIIDKCHELEIRTVATDVNTVDAFHLAKELGFDLFEGYFFTQAAPETSLNRDEKHLKLLKLLTLLLSNPELSQLDSELSENPTVAKHLIKIAEIEGKRKHRKVENVRDAVVLSGIKRITRWTQLLLYANNTAGVHLDSLPLLQHVCVRAFFMENAAGRLGAGGGLASTDLAFLTGGLSLVEVLFNKPSREVLQDFNLPHVVVDAISDGSGFLGQLLELARAAELGDEEAMRILAVDDLEPLTMQAIADDSLHAIRSFVQQTQEEPDEDEWPDADVEEAADEQSST
ncbi:EAL and HDOD domain-containing protein [Polynucleobacter sp. UK-Mo-2m-Kol15]|uniref:EAL and HDOD domain-containing protein n=1 Tax=Polynucleobacter sp. UK-Mo-2m-Kol15 TaxID=2576916 RepID=UPI001C0E5A51|nr:EAL domain-containing protein [Polynucleobacter sp. UK-Mo-2m-Kol15]MBU3575954.1 EAL domain-containing protein [Polynucleobacter sp. UK-Mo-2m-Kol15]